MDNVRKRQEKHEQEKFEAFSGADLKQSPGNFCDRAWGGRGVNV